MYLDRSSDRLLQLRVFKPASSFSTKLLPAASSEGPRKVTKLNETWKPIKSYRRVAEYLSGTYKILTILIPYLYVQSNKYSVTPG